jgi:hypothetical protein
VLLLVSDTCAEEGPHNLYLLQRWFPLMLQVTGERLSMRNKHTADAVPLGSAPRGYQPKAQAAASRVIENTCACMIKLGIVVEHLVTVSILGILSAWHVEVISLITGVCLLACWGVLLLLLLLLQALRHMLLGAC